tara:strand:- start:382 stop:876 length:495 start_codon:yes stop_codon:yes gene_type:complete
MDIYIVLNELKKDEGFRGSYYLCSAGKKTIGYGRNVESNNFSEEEKMILGLPERDFEIEPMNESEAEVLLINDIDRIIKRLSMKLDFFDDLHDIRKGVLVNMAFNIGVFGLMKFKNTLRFCKYGEFINASYEMLDSKWAGQVPSRAFKLSQMMGLGVCYKTISY